MWNGVLAGNFILVSIILIVLSYFMCLSNSKVPLPCKICVDVADETYHLWADGSAGRLAIVHSGFLGKIHLIKVDKLEVLICITGKKQTTSLRPL